ncbi:hypothetical protein NKR19_g8586 [Coniochaeta hoffmannii]|uniref:Uncharacterized protein n=1 Tax=Coniochaeta hoffmannii TaxID=91930 RepID=A0AA38RNL3_9PEZI|nr:hypothetical protein NKR19_g8586 [Coniochaeta hoffmannii]
MRTMPLELTSSVDVVSTDRAHRRHRSTSTETTGLVDESMLCRAEEPDLEPERSESDEEYEEADDALP